MHSDLRERLVATTLQWERAFGNAPSITSALSEFDAAMLVGMTVDEYSECMRGATAVQKGYDFIYKGKRYQVKGNRPSGKPGSFVTLVPKALNYEWDCLVWVLYDPKYNIKEAWLWEVDEYRTQFHEIKRLSPAHYRKGRPLHRPTVVGEPDQAACTHANPCPFCSLPDERIVDANEHAIVIRDGYPVAQGHTLVIPRRHVGSFFELTCAEQTAMLALLDKAQEDLRREISPVGFNIGINDGPAAGQTVPHVHMHLIPRRHGDVPDPRGGVRWVIPDKARYWKD